MVCLWYQQGILGTKRAKLCTWTGNVLTVYAPISTDITGTQCAEVTITTTNADDNDMHGVEMPAAGKHTWEFSINIDGTADADGALDIEYIGKYDYTVLTANHFKYFYVIPGHTTENLINLIEFQIKFTTLLPAGGGFIIYFPTKDMYDKTIFRNDLGIQYEDEQYQKNGDAYDYFRIQNGHTFPCAVRAAASNGNCPNNIDDVVCTLYYGSRHGTTAGNNIAYEYTEVHMKMG